MNIEKLKDQIPEYAKDIKLNLSSVLDESGASGLTMKQIAVVTLASAHACKNQSLLSVFKEASAEHLSSQEQDAAIAASIIMAMNNVYYRFTHLVGDEDYVKMPARLRMNVIGNPGIDKVDFELASLAVSAINGCGACMEAHAGALTKKHGVSKESVQSAVRIASVVHAASVCV